jgi:hypothetical protein
LRLNAKQAKTGKGRTVHLPEVAQAWLKVAPEGPVANPLNSRPAWDMARAVWVLLHTAPA